ncbi:MAG TPA: alpha/beta hydrolase [Candidatus Limnocylindrales bacterium]|nr:alpha/beta hydrolase [Candidatus Limnocylindrales bacterium]
MPHTEIDGIRIHYHAPRDPAPARGQRVLYVHGTGCNGRVWEEHMQAIADAHTPVAIDLPGHGQSGGRGFRGVGDYAHFTVELARALGWSRFVVAGHSMGGAIAITIALYHAELLAGLALVDTGARLRVGPDILKAARAAAQSGRAVPTDRSWGFAPGTPPSVVDSVNALTAGTDPRVTYADWIADDMFDAMARVKDITVPTLVLCGAEDRLTPIRNHRYLQERIRGSQLTVIDRAGHWVFHEQPEAFTRAMRGFLDGLPEESTK